jgi:AAA domain
MPASYAVKRQVGEEAVKMWIVGAPSRMMLGAWACRLQPFDARSSVVVSDARCSNSVIMRRAPRSCLVDIDAWDWEKFLDASPVIGMTAPRGRHPDHRGRVASREAPEPLLLNSFFLGDLSRAMSLWRSGTAPPNLRRYLGTERPSARSDLLQDYEALRQAIAPSMFPLARWPGADRHPLVLLQQAAVNLATHTLAEDGILAVNGPPGTGKTTLLRDVVAALMTERAEIMASFDDPAAAFTNSGQRISAGNAWLHLYRLDERLKGFEMLVASSNNKAVENVSAELPGLNAIADDATDLRYFKAVSDGLLNRETWGLIAAVLGNAQNRSAFRQGFWWDSELGLSTYLAHASGTPQIVDVLNERGEIIGQRPPLIVTQEDPPRDTRDALQRWQRARRVFRATLERSRDARQDLQAVHQFQMSMPSLTRDLEDLTHRLASAKDSHRRAVDQHLAAALNCEDREAAFSAAQRAWQDHTRSRPGFFSRLFRTTRHKIWVARELVLHRYFDHTKIIAAEAASLKTRATSLLSTTNDNLKAAEAAHAEAASSTSAQSKRWPPGDAVSDPALSMTLLQTGSTQIATRSPLGSMMKLIGCVMMCLLPPCPYTKRSSTRPPSRCDTTSASS